jgi:hypothetical protein
MITSWRARPARAAAVATAFLFGYLPVAAGAVDDNAMAETKPWLSCLVEKARRLSKSPDSAATVAAAATTLCSELEGPVRGWLNRSSVEKLVRNGVVANHTEGWRVVQSIGDEGWQRYLAQMNAQVAAVIVDMRAVAITSSGVQSRK